MPGLSFKKKQLTEKYLDKLAIYVSGRRATAEYFTVSASDMVINTAKEREYNQIIARHLREAREREAAGKPLTRVQKAAQYWRGREESDDQYELETFSSIGRYPPEERARRARRARNIENRARARLEADRAEEDRELPSYNPSPIPAPPYKSRKTPWRTLKSRMTKTLFGRRKKTSSPAPPYYPGVAPDASDVEVGGSRKSSGRRKTRKFKRN